MKQNKALLNLSGKTIIEATLDRVSVLSEVHFIVTNDPGLYSFIKHVCIIEDLFPGRGPLGGIVTAFKEIDFPFLVMCACDMPFASPELFQLEFETLISQNFDVVIPQYQGKLEPLHAVYRKQTCIEPAVSHFQQGGRKIIDWFSQVKVKVITEADFPGSGPHGDAFFNVNTPEDYAAAKKLFLKKQSK